jgi:hypothetical protein
LISKPEFISKLGTPAKNIFEKTLKLKYGVLHDRYQLEHKLLGYTIVPESPHGTYRTYFDYLDTNKNNVIEPLETLNAIMLADKNFKLKNYSKDDMIKAFSLMDSNNDGRVTYEEWNNMLIVPNSLMLSLMKGMIDTNLRENEGEPWPPRLTPGRPIADPDSKDSYIRLEKEYLYTDFGGFCQCGKNNIYVASAIDENCNSMFCENPAQKICFRHSGKWVQDHAGHGVVCSTENNDPDSVYDTSESDHSYDHGPGSDGDHNEIYRGDQRWLDESAIANIFEELNLNEYPMQEILFKVKEEDPLIFNAKDSTGNLLDDRLKVTSIQFK